MGKDENYESWLDRARDHEMSIALKRIKNGESPDKVLEDFSKNMLNKAMHPILKAIQDCPTNYDAEASKKSYFEKIKQKGASSDHVADD